ncbi:colanic acid biosynthesis acetyltransferase WcaF [Prodigiosinella confusarubida]|uniref:Colanic acid biosynthesis acetyltransferase WcaF n=1 Tax=Serratia sp. (strain ATCC 39006) TaxID=104623 RepID=A0A2I5TIJ8_SERS3|nr:putative colanic acid biosynthesis acetyltransferase [Serratia sp. ATCC 39006]AUH00078.1 colanic acid biosynthesis acetyltransferase WcaF [Serratia sp. ATCC 39006]AUH04397.1 colanic acid biosynthesis acetyltransferase WcaF [Serratia sp. ATCC 39006]
MYELDKFSLPPGFRGRSSLIVIIWWAVQATLFSWSPQFCYRWRVFLLRIFGAKIGKNVLIRQSAKITYPWKLTIGDYSWIGDDVVLYTLGKIRIGHHSIISQRCYLCTGSHDYLSSGFDIIEKPIYIGDSCWLATDVFVSPGVSIENECVVGARSSVFNNLQNNAIYRGTPAVKIRDKV